MPACKLSLIRWRTIWRSYHQNSSLMVFRCVGVCLFMTVQCELLVEWPFPGLGFQITWQCTVKTNSWSLLEKWRKKLFSAQIRPPVTDVQRRAVPASVSVLCSFSDLSKDSSHFPRHLASCPETLVLLFEFLPKYLWILTLKGYSPTINCRASWRTRVMSREGLVSFFTLDFP